MVAKLEKIENSEAYLNIEVDTEKFEEGLEKAYKKVVKQVAIPGFRKGKVPRPLLEAHFGKEVLYEDALEFVVPDAFAAAIMELGLEPIAKPEYQFNTIEAGKPVEFSVKVAVKPEVKLGNMEGLQISIPKFEINEENVNEVLENMRLRYAESVEKTDEPAELGDALDIDFDGYVNEEPFAGGSAQDYRLVLGSNSFIPGFEDQLVGVKAGESKDVKVTFPEAYHAQELAGKDAVFKVAVKKVIGKKLRELNDEFAQEISEYETLEELKDNIRKDLQNTSESKKKNAIKSEIVNKIIDICELTISPTVIEEEVQHMMEQFDQRLQQQGFNLDRYLKMTGATLDSFKEEIKPEAERNVKSHFILEKLIQEKGIEASDEELDNQIEKIASRMNITPEEARQGLGDNIVNIKMNLLIDKAFEYLIDNAVITETEAENQE